jgi:hypothetical protein
MHLFLRPSLAGSIAIVSVAFWGAFALLVIAIGPAPKVSPMATVPAIDKNMPVISLAVAEAWPVSTAKSDRLPWPPPAEPEPAIRPRRSAAPMPRLPICACATACTKSGPRTAEAGGAGDEGLDQAAETVFQHGETAKRIKARVIAV